jgi:membrane protease subunit (stomatin/prohibitin family)
MAIIDVVKWDEETYAKACAEANRGLSLPMDEIYAWKFPSNELSTWTQLIVHESQEAVLFRAGAMDGPFAPGRHVLKTENLPVLKNVLNLPFGRSPFTAEVWFTNRAIPLNVEWGKDKNGKWVEPIRLFDPVYKISVPVVAHGQYAVQIEHSRKFLVKLVGALSEFSRAKLEDYLRGMILTIAKTTIAKEVVQKGTTVLHIAAELMSISSAIEKELKVSLEEYGLKLVNFYVSHIDVKEGDESIIKIQNALAKKAEMDIVGYNYQQERGFNAIEGATGFTGQDGNAKNHLQNTAADSGITGALIGAGLGIGVGVPLGQMMNHQMGQIGKQTDFRSQQSAASNAMGSEGGNSAPSQEGSGGDRAQKIKLIVGLVDLQVQGFMSDEEFLMKIQKILSS